jgi:hypothetical protein
VNRRQASHQCLEHFHPPLEPLDRFALLVAHVLNVRACPPAREESEFALCR